ncbi:MAG: YitT family protein [Pseudomonadota bacterium]
MKTGKYHRISSIFHNLLLISLGSLVFGFGVKAIAVPNGMITGGMSGVGLLLYYATGKLSPGLWYLVINLPIFIAGWLMVSRRFFFYSLYGMLVASFAMDLITVTVPIHDGFLVMLAGGAVIGAGAGITFHSLGSMGGNDIIAVILNQRYSVRMGTYFFIFNIVLFALSFGVIPVDMVLYSLSMSFVTSQVLDYVLSMFNQRKMVLIITDAAERISADINARLQRGATLIAGVGSFTKAPRTVVMTVVHNVQLKRLEELVLTTDPDAFMIMENTFNVIGRGFSRRKVY